MDGGCERCAGIHRAQTLGNTQLPCNCPCHTPLYECFKCSKRFISLNEMVAHGKECVKDVKASQKKGDLE